MRALLEHGGKAKEFSRRRLVHGHFLVVLIHGADSHPARDHDVAAITRVAAFVNPLVRGEGFKFDLGGQDGGFITVETGKKGNLLEDFRITCHKRAPRPAGTSSRRG